MGMVVRLKLLQQGFKNLIHLHGADTLTPSSECLGITGAGAHHASWTNKWLLHTYHYLLLVADVQMVLRWRAVVLTLRDIRYALKSVTSK